MSHDICGLTGCNKKHYAQGLCGPHYKRLWAYGTTADQPKDSEDRQVIPAQAVEAATDAWLAHKSTRSPDNAKDAIREALEAAAPHMLASALQLADKWQEDFPYKARELRAALGVTND